MSNTALKISNNALDFNKAKAKEALLKPFPAKKITKMAQTFFAENGIGPDDPLDTDYIWNMLSNLYEFSKEKLKFGDWRYQIISFWDISDEIFYIEIKAEKLNTLIQLSINKTMWIEEDLLFNDKNVAEDEYGIEYVSCNFFLKKFYKFMEETKNKILKWNKICMNSKPIINSKPPVKKIVNNLLEDFLTEVANVEWKENCYYEEYETFEEFMEFHPFWIGYTLMYTILNNTWDFGSKNQYHFHCEEINIDGEFIILNGYITVTNSPISFSVFREEFNLYYESFYGTNMAGYFKMIGDKILDSVIQWNEIILGRR